MNSTSENAQKLQRLLQITRDVFKQDVIVNTSEDPEYPEDLYTVFEVEVNATIADIVAMELEWARKVNVIAPGDSSFRLLLTAAS